MKQLTISSFLLISCLFFSQYIYAENSYVFAIAPQQSANKTAERWLPILDYISEKSGIKLRFRTEKDISAFKKKLDSASYDFAYMNSFLYTHYHEKSSYNALLKSENKRIKGIIVVKKDSPVKTIQDLSGKTIVFPSPNEVAASKLNQTDLKKKNIPFTPRYVSSHESVYNNIIQDNAIAGGSVSHKLRKMKPEIKNNLRILHKTRVFTPHAIAAHEKIPEKDILSIQNAFVKMRKDPEAKKLLKKAKLKRLGKAEDKDWDNVRSLNIKNP